MPWQFSWRSRPAEEQATPAQDAEPGCLSRVQTGTQNGFISGYVLGNVYGMLQHCLADTAGCLQ